MNDVRSSRFVVDFGSPFQGRPKKPSWKLGRRGVRDLEQERARITLPNTNDGNRRKGWFHEVRADLYDREALPFGGRKGEKTKRGGKLKNAARRLRQGRLSYVALLELLVG
jgi:hypothetical protein